MLCGVSLCFTLTFLLSIRDLCRVWSTWLRPTASLSLSATSVPLRLLLPRVSSWVRMLLAPFAVSVCLLLLWVTASYRFTTSLTVRVLPWSIYSALAVTCEADKEPRSLPKSLDSCSFPPCPFLCSPPSPLSAQLCILSRAAPTQGGDESVGKLPVDIPDTWISSNASHFSSLGDPITGLSEKMCFFF